MTEAKWLECEDWASMLSFLSRRRTERKKGLYLCAALRSLWKLLDDGSRDAVQVAERVAEGTVLDDKLCEALSHLSPQKEWPGGWLVREIMGNPFRPVTISSACLSWNDAIVVRLAQAAYDERILPAGTLDNTRLLILADALEEAGCTDEQILTHLRSGGEHYRGCFVLDALLGKS